MAFKASVFIVAAFLLAAGIVDAAVTCGQVTSSLAPCLGYVRGAAPLSSACCTGVKSLNAVASTTPDRQQACTCLKGLAAKVPNWKPALAAGVPGKCNVYIPYAISLSTDCTKVH